MEIVNPFEALSCMHKYYAATYLIGLKVAYDCVAMN